MGQAAVRAVLDLASAMAKGILSAAEWGAKMRNSLTALSGGDARIGQAQEGRAAIARPRTSHCRRCDKQAEADNQRRDSAQARR